MALPNQSNNLQSTMRSREIQQYQEFTMKEAVKTATKAGLFTAISNTIVKSPILRRVPGMGAIREGMEIKKRELYERTGRDESGRKLTKRELEDRELRRKDAGALASIWELLDQEWRKGVPVIVQGVESAGFGEIFGAHMFGGAVGREKFRPISREYGKDNVTVTPSGEGAYDIQEESSEKLERREEAAEQERADDADAAADNERDEGFFTNLFAKTFGSRDRSKSGGLIDSLLGLVGPLLGIFGGGGGIIGMLSSIVAPLMGVLATAGTAIIGFITPLLPVIVGGLIVGAAGLAIKSWIDSWIEEKENDPGTKRGIARAYSVRDPNTGISTLKTAEEMGTTDEKIQKEEFSVPGLNRTPILMEKDESGKLTGRLARGVPHSEKSITAFRDHTRGENTLEAVMDIPREAESIKPRGWNISRDEFMRIFFDLDSRMLDYSRGLNADREKISSSEALRNSYLQDWNMIRDHVDKLVNESKEKYGIPPKEMALRIYRSVSRNYQAFKGMIDPRTLTVRPEKAEPVDQLFYSDISIPYELDGTRRQIVDDLMVPSEQKAPFSFGGTTGRKPIEPENTAFGSNNSTNLGTPTPKIQGKPLRTLPTVAPAEADRGGNTTIINNNSSTSTANVSGAQSARVPTGIDQEWFFQGARIGFA
jgi:hypothetical protein